MSDLYNFKSNIPNLVLQGDFLCDGKTLNRLEPGKEFKANLTIKNFTSETQKVTLIVQIRVQNYSVSIKLNETNVLPNGFDSISVISQIPDTFGITIEDCIDIFIWDSLDNMNPLGDMLVIPCERLLKLTSPMMSGYDVECVQLKLNELGFNCGSVDGYYGENTKTAVENFQSSSSLEVNGIVDSNTWNTLFSADNNPNTDSIDKFVSIAIGELGVTEDPIGSNNTKYNDWFNWTGAPWCAMFVSWCANEAGILGNLFPKKTASVWEIKDAYEKSDDYKYRSSGYIPKAGDIVIFSNNNNPYRHTGIVVGYIPSENRIYTVEGNSSDKVSARYYNLDEPIDIQGYGLNYGTSNGQSLSGATKGNNAKYQ